VQGGEIGATPRFTVHADAQATQEDAQASESVPELVPESTDEKTDADESAPPNANPDEKNEAASSSRPTFDRQSDEILESLLPVTVDANRVTVKVSTQNRPVALGLIVDSSGLVLTKASELKGKLECKLSDGRTLSASVFGIHQSTDLALLKIEAGPLPVADWSLADAPPVGYWVVTPKLDKPPSLGIVSVKPRAISPPAGYMGVELKQEPRDSGVRIDRILANSPAEQAGLRVNDIIVEVNGEKVTDQVMLIATIQKHTVGAEVRVKVLRGTESLDFTVTLTDYSVFGRNADRSEIQNEMGGRLSKRRLDFPMALQHDTPLSPSECGGPLIDLTGKIVGVNIARAGRVDSLALPTATVLSVIEALKSGDLRPAMVFKSEIERIQARLTEIGAEMQGLPQRQSELSEQLGRDDEKLEELKKMAEDIQTRLQELEEQRGKTAKLWDATKSDEERLQKEKERLEHDLERYTTGTN
jgi:serine protease Do